MTFEEILTECIEAIEQGKTVEECLTKYPSHATELESLLLIVASLHDATAPRLSNAAFTRGRTDVAQAALARQMITIQTAPSAPEEIAPTPPRTQQPTRAPQRPAVSRPIFSWPQLAGALIAACVLLFAFGLVRSAGGSLPGNPLYVVKRLSEEMQGLLLAASGSQSEWHARQLQRRIDEAVSLQEQGRPIQPALVELIIENANAALITGNTLPSGERASYLRGLLDALGYLEQQTTLSTASLATVQQTTETIETTLAAGGSPTVVAMLKPTFTATAATSVASMATATMDVTPEPASTPSPLPPATATSQVQPAVEPTPDLPTATPRPAATATSAQQLAASPAATLPFTPPPLVAPLATSVPATTPAPTSAPTATPGPALSPTATWTALPLVLALTNTPVAMPASALQSTSGPEDSGAIEPTVTMTVSVTPSITATLEVTATLKVTATLEVTATLAPTTVPEGTAAPKLTETPVPTNTLALNPTPAPTNTPEPLGTETSTEVVVPTSALTSTATATAAITPPTPQTTLTATKTPTLPAVATESLPSPSPTPQTIPTATKTPTLPSVATESLPLPSPTLSPVPVSTPTETATPAGMASPLGVPTVSPTPTPLAADAQRDRSGRIALAS